MTFKHKKVEKKDLKKYKDLIILDINSFSELEELLITKKYRDIVKTNLTLFFGAFALQRGYYIFEEVIDESK